jgi:hypothetical protein
MMNRRLVPAVDCADGWGTTSPAPLPLQLRGGPGDSGEDLGRFMPGVSGALTPLWPEAKKERVGAEISSIRPSAARSPLCDGPANDGPAA